MVTLENQHLPQIGTLFGGKVKFLQTWFCEDLKKIYICQIHIFKFSVNCRVNAKKWEKSQLWFSNVLFWVKLGQLSWVQIFIQKNFKGQNCTLQYTFYCKNKREGNLRHWFKFHNFVLRMGANPFWLLNLLDFTCSMKIHHSWMIWGPLKIQYNKPNIPSGPSVFLYPSNRMEFGLLLYSKPSVCQNGVAPVDHQLEH